MTEYVFDLEADGLLEDVTKIHSLVLKDTEWGDVISAHHETVEDALLKLMNADLICGHNVIRYDIPTIQKLYPWFTVDRRKVLDTLVLSRLIWPNIEETDWVRIRAAKTMLPPKLAGSHSLESWGFRLDAWKGDYAKIKEEELRDSHHLEGLPQPTDEELRRHVWGEWSEEMQAYCEQDVEVTLKLFELCRAKGYSEEAIRLEHDVAWIIAQQERDGFGFDEEKAWKLYHDLTSERVTLEESLTSLFKPWWVKDGPVKAWAKDMKLKTGEIRIAGAERQPIKLQVFNPGSRDHIADRLMKVRGWKPQDFTDGGKPKVDETVLDALPYPEAKRLAKYFQVKKVLGQLADGDKAWLKFATKGRIHGSVNPNGAVTGRATHSFPNIAQVPSIKAYRGPECRELFGPLHPEHVQLGCDVSGLELRMLGHFMARYDDGVYAREVVDGDVHTANQLAAGLPTRDSAKTFIYAFLYGAGDEKIGSIVGKSKKHGRMLKKEFLSKTPALKKLIEGVQKAAEQKGHLKGLDGRLLHIRSPHAALNTLLQSAGALVCKQWLVEFHTLLEEHGLTDRVRQMAWVHDEVQLSVHKSLVNDDGTSIVGDLCIRAIERAGAFFKLRVPLTGEYKIGNNWKDCH